MFHLLPDNVATPSDDDENFDDLIPPPSDAFLQTSNVTVQSMSPAPEVPIPPRGPPPPPPNMVDTVDDTDMRSIPIEADPTLATVISMQETRSHIRSRRIRQRRDQRDTSQLSDIGDRDSEPPEEIFVLCPICRREDSNRDYLDKYVIQKAKERRYALVAICELAWSSICKRDAMYGNTEPITIEDVAYHVRRCLSHPALLGAEVRDIWRGKIQNLQASGGVGRTNSGATIYAPSHIKELSMATTELLKWTKLKDTDMIGYKDEPTVSEQADRGFTQIGVKLH